MKRVLLASVGVNKAADYYAKAEEMVPPSGPRPSVSGEADELPPGRRQRPRPRKERRITTTLERLRHEEGELDAALRRSYERFSGGELTARDMDRERDQLIRAFNQRVMSENIRYRSMLRRLSNRSG
jgi:hypothetical protein